MREIIVVGYQNYDFAKSLVVGEIIYKDFYLDLQDFTSLIFTSKNAIHSLQHNAFKYPQMQSWKKIPSYVIGKGSARVLQEFGGNLGAISPNFHGEEFVAFLKNLLNFDESLLYLRAENIVSNLDEKLIQSGFSLTSQIAYRSSPLTLSPSQRPSYGSVLLFTSPSAYKYFLNNFQWDKSYLAIALGQSTYKSFLQGINKEVSPTQDIAESIKLLCNRFGV